MPESKSKHIKATPAPDPIPDPIPNPTPVVLLNFISTDWLPATKRWSKTWICPHTGAVGSGIYFPDDGSSFSLDATDLKSRIVVIKGDRNAPPDPNKVTVMLQICGGTPAYQEAPDKAYINLNPAFVGARFMYFADYEQACTERGLPVHTPTTLLDSYRSSST